MLKQQIWTNLKLVSIADEKRVSYTPSESEHLSYLGLEHIGQQSLRLTGVGDSAETDSQKKRFTAGDILYGSLRPYFRKVYRPKFNGVCSTDLTVLSSKGENLNSYLFYLIASPDFIKKATSASNGTKMPRAGWKIVKNFEFNRKNSPQLAAVVLR
jgi:type I restriction enzyme, S subunit